MDRPNRGARLSTPTTAASGTREGNKPLHLTINEAVAATDQIVTELGENYVYEFVGGGCVYINPDTGEFSCLIGRVLHRMGVPKEHFKECSADTLLSHFKVNEWHTAEDGLLGYLTVMQNAQDNGHPYGMVRRIGKAYLRGWSDGRAQS